jgi:hypothetical protein
VQRGHRPYEVDGEVVGSVGVIGPTRMAYERVIPIVEITAKLLSSALTYPGQILMPPYLPEPAYRHGSPARRPADQPGDTGSADGAAVRRYLKEFLSDPRVVEIPRAVWWLILNGIILNIRPRRSAEKYAAVWTAEGSPLKVHVERQAKLLRGFLGQAGHRVLVDFAMRYGEPSIPATLSRLKAEGCTRILLLPLYPQYSASTTATPSMRLAPGCRACAISRKYAWSGVSPITPATLLRWQPVFASTGPAWAGRTDRIAWS